ncbi:FkbM family methyltransferase [Rhodobacteraceae bacterium XHP0102]|nr:FkbM family methyltransferase [Rhodobacteraceae bacterium XHP0102]
MSFFKALYRAILRRPRHPLQRKFLSKGYVLNRLGSTYGGWTFADNKDLQRSIIVAAGLGEDASFDVAFAEKYDARVIIVDPTPRAAAHFQEILAALGSPASSGYVSGGKQPISAYDLSKINRDQLTLVEKALWNHEGEMRFYAPANDAHVSHSLLSGQGGTSRSRHITVQATTIAGLFRQLAIEPSTVPLIKMDIEGAAFEVLETMFEDGIFPRQLLVEFDELHHLNSENYARVTNAHERIIAAGYELIYSDGHSNVTYYRA